MDITNLWWYELNGQQNGPVTKEEIQDFIKNGSLRTNNLVWQNGWPNWIIISETEFLNDLRSHQILKQASTIQTNNSNAAVHEYNKYLVDVKGGNYQNAMNYITTAIALDSKQEYLQAHSELIELLKMINYKQAKELLSNKNYLKAYSAIQISLKYDPENNDYLSLKKNIETTKKTAGKRVKLYTVSIIVLIAILFACFYYIYSKRSKEDLVWDKTTSERNLSSYNEYLNLYRSGRYKLDADDSIAKIKKIDNQDWNDANQNATIFSIQSYITNHPQGKYFDDAQGKIDSLYWDDCIKDENNKYAYLRYIQKIPKGKHLTDAQNKLSKIQFANISDPDKEAVKNVIKLFYTSIFNQKYEDLAFFLPPVIDRYMGLEHVGKAHLIEVIRNWIEKHKVINQRNSIDWNSFQATRISEKTILAEFNVDNYYTAETPSVEYTFNSNVRMILNLDLKITSLTQENISHSSRPVNN